MTIRIPYLMAALLVATSFCSDLCTAQEANHRTASLAFDINGQAIMQSEFFKTLPEPPEQDPMARVMRARRIFGAMSVPESIEALNQFQMTGTPVPVELFTVAEFDSEEDREKVIPAAVLEGIETVDINGKQYYLEPRIENIYLLLGEKSLEVGTEQYLMVQKSELLSTNLKLAMAELGKAPLRIALDLTQDRQQLREIVDLMKPLGVMAAPFLELPKRMDQLLLSIDPDGDTMVNLVAKSSSQDDAAYVTKTLNALIGFGKMGLQSAPKDDPNAELAKLLIDSISVKTDGNNAVLTLKKPANLEKFLDSMKERFQQQMDQSRRANNLRQALLSMHNYESTYRAIPFNHTAGGRFSEDLSWRVRVLPFIEEANLYNKFDLTQPWDSDRNKPLAEEMPALFGKDGMTGICWIVSDVEGFSDITDGLSYTICLIESKQLVPWTQAEDITAEDAEKMILGLPDGEKILVGMYDGSVRQLDNKTPPETLRAMLTPAGGEVVNF